MHGIREKDFDIRLVSLQTYEIQQLSREGCGRCLARIVAVTTFYVARLSVYADLGPGQNNPLIIISH
jgi:hypothetical protein